MDANILNTSTVLKADNSAAPSVGAYGQTEKEISVKNFPAHLFTPSGARTFDFARLVSVPAGTVNATLIDFLVPEGFVLNMTHYGVFSDALYTADAFFDFKANGFRIFPFHGNPMDQMKIALGLTAGLGNDSLREANVALRPNFRLQVYVTNNSVVGTTMGCRLKGWIDNSMKQNTVRFGG